MGNPVQGVVFEKNPNSPRHLGLFSISCLPLKVNAFDLIIWKEYPLKHGPIMNYGSIPLELQRILSCLRYKA